MEEDDCTWYQCKLCDSRFKTTAEVQKHKRLVHRNSASSDSAVPNVSKPEKPSYPISNVTERVIESGRVTRQHGTRYSKTRSSNYKEDKISLGQERHLSCASCGHNFDSKDPVVLHLLRQSRNENGSFKCPYCAKILLEASNALPTSAAVSNTDDYKSQDRTPKASDRSSRHSRRKSWSDAGNVGNGKATAKNYSSVDIVKKDSKNTSSSRSLDVSALQEKRKLSLSSESSTPARKKRTDVFVGHHGGISSKSTEAKAVSPGTAMEGTSDLSATNATTPYVPMQPGLERHFEVTYRQPRGKGSRGGRVGGCRRASGVDRNSNEFAEDNSQNSVDAPLKVSVLINNNPVSSATRLAIPKGSQFEKGNIRCPYCGYEAKSVREVQFHVNTHMPKSYPCEYCSAIYRSKQAVMNHTAKYHSDKVSKLNTFSNDTSHSSQKDAKEIENDQRSMSNYSFSCASENYSNEDSYSQDSNIENNDSFSYTAAESTYYASQIQNERLTQDQVYLSPTVNALFYQQHQDVFSGEKVGAGSVEKVLDISNF